MCIFLSKVYLEEEEEYKNCLRTTAECFDELCIVVKDDATKLTANMGDASAAKLKLAFMFSSF